MYSAAIGACEKGRQWQRALGLVEEAQSHGLQADVMTYSAAIGACEKNWQWQRALAMTEMPLHRLQAGVIMYSATSATARRASGRGAP